MAAPTLEAPPLLSRPADLAHGAAGVRNSTFVRLLRFALANVRRRPERFVLAVFGIAFAAVKLIALPFGGISSSLAVFWGFLLVVVAIGVMVVIGRRRQKAARERAAAARAPK